MDSSFYWREWLYWRQWQGQGRETVERDYQEGAFRLVSRQGSEIYAAGSYRLCERLRVTNHPDALIQVCTELQDDGRLQGWATLA